MKTRGTLLSAKTKRLNATNSGYPGPYWFFFHSFDCNEPIHVHVRRERRTCKFWPEPIQLGANHGFTARELTSFGDLSEFTAIP
jgi:Domain of unknown function (DUF4160)